MRHLAGLFLLLFLAACSTTPDRQAATPGDRTAEETAGERLIAAIPEDWHKILDIEGDTTRYSDWVPEGQDGTNWENRLSFEAFSLAGISSDPIDVLDAEAMEDRNRCEFVQQYNVFSGYENNYQTSVRLFLCGENVFAGKGEIKLVKVIRGEQYLHSVRLVRRIPPFEPGGQQFEDSEIAAWSMYMNRVALCDGSERHPCPPTGEADS